jgi:hypothetical protein
VKTKKTAKSVKGTKPPTKTLEQAIEDGDDIVGRKVYYDVDTFNDESCMVKMRVLGLAATDRFGIRLTPVSGAGEIVVRPEHLVEDTSAALRKYRARQSVNKCYRSFRRQTLVRQRVLLSEIRDGLTAKARALLDEEIVGRACRPTPKMSGIDSRDAEHLYLFALNLEAGLAPEDQ